MSLGTGPTNGGRSDVDSIPPQPTVMVTGRAGRPLYAVATELFERRTTDSDGAVVVTTRESPTAIVDRLTGGDRAVDPSNLAVVDARDAPEDGDSAVGWLRVVDPGAPAEEIDDAVTAGLAWLGEEEVDRRHFLCDTLAADERLPDEEAAYDRAYQVAMTVGAEDGLALFTLDTGALSDDTVERLTHLFDVHVELREDAGDTQLRWTGLLGASDGWVGTAEADLGVGGFR
jgi:hypothetical protein